MSVNFLVNRYIFTLVNFICKFLVQQDGVILFLLPYLVPCGRQKRRNDDQEETRKLTPSERRKAFIIYASVNIRSKIVKIFCRI